MCDGSNETQFPGGKVYGEQKRAGKVELEKKSGKIPNEVNGNGSACLSFIP